MRELHGISGANKVSATDNSTQQVRVIDGIREVILYHTASDAAGLSPEQARFIAKLLVEAADRVEQADAKPV